MNTWRTDIPKPRMFCWSCPPWQLWVRQTDVSFHYILNHKGVAKSVLKGKCGGHRFTEYFGNKKKKRRRRSPFTPTPLFERQDFRRKIWSWHILPQTVSGSSLVLRAQFSFLGLGELAPPLWVAGWISLRASYFLTSCQSPTFAHLTLGPSSPSSLGPWDLPPLFGWPATAGWVPVPPPVWKRFPSSPLGLGWSSL